MPPLPHPARWLPLCLLLAAAAIAQPRVDLGADRLIHRFDFEEADDQNFEDMPRNWYVIGRGEQTSDPNFARKPLHRQMMKRDGFPKHSVVKFNQPQSQKGDHNLHLSLSGGSAGAFLEVGTLAAIPGSDYVVTARIRTDKLRHARARLIAYFIDADGKRIDASAVASDFVSTDEAWRGVSIRLDGEHTAAAWIGLQAELLQPQHQTPLAADPANPAAALRLEAGKHEVVYQDVKGNAWFDDIAIWQAPRIVVRTQSLVNLIVQPAKPLVTVEVRDMSGRRLQSVMSVYDTRGRLVARSERAVGGGSEAGTWQWLPTLPGLGWYLIDMTVHDTNSSGVAVGDPVARTLRSILWLPPRGRIDAGEPRRFTLDLHESTLDDLAAAPPVLAATGLSSVVISAWDRDVTLATLDSHLLRLDAVAQRFWKQEISIIMNLHPMPRELTDRLDIDADMSVLIFGAPAKDWSPLLTPLMLRHGQNVRRWHMGRTLVNSPDLRPVTAAVATSVDVLRDLTPEPRVLLPWPLHAPRRPEFDALDVEYGLEAPASIVPSRLADYLREWDRPPRKPVTISLEIPGADQMEQARRVDDLALRVLHAWDANVDGITIARPWTAAGDRRHSLQPDPLLGVIATIAHQLTGRRAIGRLNLGEHRQAIIFDGPRGPMIAAWLEGGLDDRGSLDLFLGDAPRASDVWGNPVTINESHGRHQLTLTSTPVFIEAIDAQLAMLRAGFTATPLQIESSQTAHEHTITLVNPWPQTLQGELTIIEPGREWRIEPRRISVLIEPGEKATYSIQMQPPVAELAGAKRLVARLDFAAGKRKSIDLTAPMELGLPGIVMDTGLSLARNDKTGKLDAIVTAFVTNQSDKPRSLYLFGMTTGHPRQERIISLKPGQSVMRRFRFEDMTSDVMKAPLRIGLRDASGPALMNHALRFDE